MKPKFQPFSRSIEKGIKRHLTCTLFIQIITDGNPLTTAKSLRLFLRSMKWRKDDKISTDEFYSIYNAFIKLSRTSKKSQKHKPISYRIFSSLFTKCKTSDVYQYVKTMQKLPKRHWVQTGIYPKPILKQIERVFRILDWKQSGSLTIDELYPFVIAIRGESHLVSSMDVGSLVDLASSFIRESKGGLMTFRRFLDCFPRDESSFRKTAISTFGHIAEQLEHEILPIFHSYKKKETGTEKEEETEGEKVDKKTKKRSPTRSKSDEDYPVKINFWEMACIDTHLSRSEETLQLLEHLMNETCELRARLGQQILTKPGQFEIFEDFMTRSYEVSKKKKSSPTSPKTPTGNEKKKFQHPTSPHFSSEEYENMFAYVHCVIEKYEGLLTSRLRNYWEKKFEENADSVLRIMASGSGSFVPSNTKSTKKHQESQTTRSEVFGLSGFSNLDTIREYAVGQVSPSVVRNDEKVVSIKNEFSTALKNMTDSVKKKQKVRSRIAKKLFD